MAIGDNILTTISVSKKYELIKKNSLVYSCEIDGNKLVWNVIENFEEENDSGEFIIKPRKEEDIDIDFIDSGKEMKQNKNNYLFKKGNNEITISTNINNIIIIFFDININ